VVALVPVLIEGGNGGDVGAFPVGFGVERLRLATAAAPVFSAASEGGNQSGYQTLIATPQCAMAQVGSVSEIAV